MKIPALRLALFSATVAFAMGCGGPSNTCKTSADCASGQVCSTGKCVTPDSGMGGGTGGGAGGGMGGGTGGGMGGGGGDMDAGTGGGMGGGGGDMDAGTGGGMGGGGGDMDAGTGGGMGGGGGDMDAGTGGGMGGGGGDMDAGTGGGMGGGGGSMDGGMGGGGGGCPTGFADCDMNAANGCEADLSLPAHCGTCMNACAGGANATATCTAGTCGLACNTGFDNCDMMAANGCESDLTAPATCGSCMNTCTAGQNQTATCFMGMCGTQCTMGFDNCDMNPANGCEANLTSPATCGTCSNACAGAANATATCSMGRCGFTCNMGFDNCDMNAMNGCEADLSTPATCGSCTNACMMGVACSAGTCTNCGLTLAGSLAPNSTVMGTLSLTRTRTSPAPSCGIVMGKGEDIWSFTLAQDSSVVIETQGSLDTLLNLRSVCTSTTDIACDDSSGPGPGDNGRISRVLTAGTYYVIVQEYDSSSLPATGGMYSLAATATPLAPNSVCTAPVVLTTGRPVSNQDSAGGGAQSTACLTSGGGQLFYTVDVPANNRAAITVTPTGMTPVSMATRILSSCAATSCVSSITGATPQTLNYDNRTTMQQTIIVSVSATTAGTNGTFDIVANVAPIPLAPNATCAAAQALTIDTPIIGETIDNGGNPLATPNCATGQLGYVRYYSVDVPGRGAVTVTATPTGFNVGLRVLSSCAATTCAVFDDNSTGTTTAETVRITNPSMSTATYIVAVSASTPGATGTFSIGATTSAPVPAANAFCDAPTALTAGMATAAELAEPGGLPLDNACVPSQTGYVRYYSVSVPAGRTLGASVTPGSSSVNVGVRVLTSCSPATCAGGSDSTTNTTTTTGPEIAILTNTSGSAQTYIIAASTVDSNPTATNNYTVLANVYTPAASGTCAGASAVMVGQTLTGESIVGGGAPPTACLPAAAGYTKYHSVTLAAGERVSVTATPTNFNLALRALDGCMASACEASSDTTTSTTGAERIELQNTTAMSKTFVVAVSAVTGVATGTYNLAVTRAGYSVASIAAACDDLSMGTALSAAVGDDVTSAVTALPSPFAFSFFGATQASFSASSNGFLQLYPGATGTTSSTAFNQAIPSTATPNNLIAPFWDDLVNVTGSNVRYATFGTAPNQRFVVEWTDFSIYSSSTTPPARAERLTFQVKLHETTNVVELHYCSIAPNGGDANRATGSGATVGLENSGGTDANRHSFNTAGAVTSGGGLRFTPQP